MSGKENNIIPLAEDYRIVLLVLDGPETEDAVYEVCGSSEQFLQLRIVPAAYYYRSDNFPRWIEPITTAKIILQVKVLAAQCERENPQGIAVIGEVHSLTKIYRQLTSSNNFYLPSLSLGRLVQVSYDLAGRTGGLVIDPSQFVVNSRSNLMHIYDNGHDFYQIDADAKTLPATSWLLPLHTYQRQDFCDGYYNYPDGPLW